MSTAPTALRTHVTTLEESNPEIIEPVPPLPQEPSAAARPSDEPELQSLGCDRLLEEFGPSGVVFAELVFEPPSSTRFRGPAPANGDDGLVPARRVRTVKVRPDRTIVDE